MISIRAVRRPRAVASVLLVLSLLAAAAPAGSATAQSTVVDTLERAYEFLHSVPGLQVHQLRVSADPAGDAGLGADATWDGYRADGTRPGTYTGSFASFAPLGIHRGVFTIDDPNVHHMRMAAPTEATTAILETGGEATADLATATAQIALGNAASSIAVSAAYGLQGCGKFASDVDACDARIGAAVAGALGGSVASLVLEATHVHVPDAPDSVSSGPRPAGRDLRLQR